MNEKLEAEAKRLSQAFMDMDFELLSDAAHQLNLYAHRGYDLTAEGNSYVRFKQKSREEFLSLIQQEFKDHGIDFELPDEAYGGQAIYFKAFGERIGILYGEDNKVRSEIGQDNVEYFKYVLDSYRERVESIQEKVRDLDRRKDVFERILKDSTIVMTEEFASDRVETLKIKTKGFRFKNKAIQRLVDMSYGKTIGKLVDHQIGLKMKRDVEKEENQKKLQEHVTFLEKEKRTELERIEGIEERMAKLNIHEPHFETVVESFFRLLKKYNIPVQGKN